MARSTSISRRTVLSRTVGVLAGLGLVSDIPAHEPAQAQAAATTSNWPQYRADAGHSARVEAGVGPTGDIEEVWKNNAIGTNPRQGLGGVAVVAQTVYVGGNKLFALDATNGQQRWAFEPKIPEIIDPGGGAVYTNVGQPAVMNDTVYVAVEFYPYEGSPSDTALIAVDAHTGKRRWRFDTDGGSYSPFDTVTAAAGSVVTSLPDGDASLLTVFTADGKKRWQQRVDGDLDPLPVTDGRVYVPTTTGVTALDVATGNEVWSALSTVRFEPAATPMVENGTLFVAEEGTPGVTLIALDAATGEEHWRTAYTPGASTPGMTIGTADKTSVYLSVEGIESTIIALERADGSERWRTTIDVRRGQKGDVSLDGFALVGGVLYCGSAAIDPSNGEPIWTHPMDVTGIGWTLEAVAGGRVYLSSKNLAVLTGTTEPPTKTTTQTSTQTETTQTTQPPTQTTTSATKTAETTQTATESETATSSPEETASRTTTAATTTSPAPATTTDGPGFGVLPAVAGVGLLAWRSLTKP